MKRETFPVAPLACNCSILYDEAMLQATVVDPGSDVNRVIAFLSQNSLTLTQIVVTHGHLDHIAGAKTLSTLTGAPVVYHSGDIAQLDWMDQQAAWMGVPTPETAPPDIEAADGMSVTIGSETGTVLHTPGHTQGSISLYFPYSSLLLAGDTLFRDGLGRTDLPGGNDRQILQSIHEKILTLPGETFVIPGHGASTTVQREADQNPFLLRLR